MRAIDGDISAKKKVIYLTFDDGPSVVTDKVLDILKEMYESKEEIKKV